VTKSALAPEPVRRTHHVPGSKPRAIYDIVTDFAAYPRLFREIKATRVLSTATDGPASRSRVEFRVEMVVAIRYVLDLVCNPEALSVDWTYVEGEVVTGSEGSWRFREQDGGTLIEYQAALTIDAPLPAFVVRKVTQALVSASLPGMFASIERELAARPSAPQV
jgi:ribosome-associated toxin RatA of RatAB toxin-antitoxin module